MSTSVGSVKLLRTITHQLGRLSIREGARSVHVYPVSNADKTLRKVSLARVETRQISVQYGMDRSLQSPLLISVLSSEVKEIIESDKPKVTYDCPQILGLDLEIDVPPFEQNKGIFDIPEQKQKIEESPESILPSLKLKQKKRNRRKNQHITIIRHIKMKRHQLKRVRKRLYPIKKKEKFLRKKKQEREFQAYLAKLRSHGTKFDAAQYVKERLEAAKKAGYTFDIGPTINMLQGKDKSP